MGRRVSIPCPLAQGGDMRSKALLRELGLHARARACVCVCVCLCVCGVRGMQPTQCRYSVSIVSAERLYSVPASARVWCVPLRTYTRTDASAARGTMNGTWKAPRTGASAARGTCMACGRHTKQTLRTAFLAASSGPAFAPVTWRRMQRRAGRLGWQLSRTLVVVLPGAPLSPQ